MVRRMSLLLCAFLWVFQGIAQEVDFKEYSLNNGLHVILHQDHSAPVVTVGVMYHVGAKDEAENRSGFAHFFEHLLFEGTKYIKKGQWDKIVSAHGGYSNANTTQDRTYYYESFPSNQLKLALWMEAERMLHPVIKEEGVQTQQEVVKEEKRMRINNAPYGKLIYGGGINPYLFKKHPYQSTTIGSMKDINAAQLDEFKAFFKKYYVPNNACLVVSGDIDKMQAKKWIKAYYAEIPKGKPVPRVHVKEAPITHEIQAVEYDANIAIPAKVFAYRTPGMSDRDTYVLNMITTLLTGGKSSRMHQALVDNTHLALQVIAFNRTYEDYGTYIIAALPMGGTPLDTLAKAMEQQIHKLKTELITEKEYQKLQNIMEDEYVNSLDTQRGIASSLATFYTLYEGKTNLINKRIDIYKSVTREEIKAVANKYLNKNQRLNLDYLPETGEKSEK